MNHYANSSRNYFSASPVDRLAAKRKDTAWLAEQLVSSHTRFLPVWKAKNLLATGDVPRPITLTADEVAALKDTCDVQLLGAFEGVTYFALSLATPSEWLNSKGNWEELRFQASLLSEAEASLAVMAKALSYWHQRHRFCGDCGSPTLSQSAGYSRVCSNTECGQTHFPRTDPAIIVLVHSDDYCLLARQPSWPPGRYSTVAGFVEPGESLEDAVVREVAEETGITVGHVCYESSQPWPFPGSLMLGYLAEATSQEIQLVDEELEHAAWFTRDELVTKVKEGTLKLPPEVAISYRLIESWFNQGNTTLQEALGRNVSW